MAKASLFLKGFLALGVMILQLVGCLLVTNMPTTSKKRGSASSHKTSSWAMLKKLVTCKFNAGEVQEPIVGSALVVQRRGYHKIGCSGSLCNLRDVVHGNTRVMHRSETSPEISSQSSTCKQSSVLSQDSGLLDHTRVSMGSSRYLNSPKPQFSIPETQGSGSFRGMHLRKLSGCYECHMIVDPIEAISRESFRTTICACPKCGEIFTKADALEQHQAIKHAVSELSEEDSARNIVEIIFQSSWLKKEKPICKIERILKVHNSLKTINKFEEYRDMVKAKANKLVKKHPRCIADGNELLRFHCTTFACSLGMNGSSSLCNLPSCNICNVIRNGFSCPKMEVGKGVYTTASSGKAHDSIELSEDELASKGKRAMLVCRVIAGRVHKSQDQDDFFSGGFDSVAGQAGLYSNLDELFVYNPKAVLPCFVVIYKAVE
eukprot:Gb_32897 [translate_table: standard]